jgi:hypothetical protein
MFRSSLAAAAVLLIGAVSACSSGSTPAKGPAGGATAGAAQQGGVAVEPATAATPPSTQRIAALRKQLLGGSDIAGFGAAGGRTYDYSVDRPCLKPTMLSAFPQHEELVTQLAGRTETFISQHVIVFGDEPTARQAYAAHVAEFGCPSGILRESDEALPVTISVPADVRAVVGAAQASTWTLDNPKQAHVVVVIAQLDDMVIDLSFSSDSAKTAIGNPLGAAKIAIAKLARA